MPTAPTQARLLSVKLCDNSGEKPRTLRQVRAFARKNRPEALTSSYSPTCAGPVIPTPEDATAEGECAAGHCMRSIFCARRGLIYP